MKNKCAGCRKFTLKDHAPMAAAGYGKCLRESATRPRRFLNALFPVVCEHFTPAPDSVVARRLQWLAEQRAAQGLAWEARP